MTNEQAIKIIQNEYKCVDRECDIERSCGKCPYMMPSKEPILKAFEMAIQALSQEPCERFEWGIDGNVYKITKAKDGKEICQQVCNDAISRVEALKIATTEYELKKIRELPSVNPQPCGDVVSRQEALNSLIDNTDLEGYDLAEALDAIEDKEKLPPVTQKSGKWDRLYIWLNDMRLGIAPDETVDDIDERHCRESQTDILDEIMEWMIKAESEE